MAKKKTNAKTVGGIRYYTCKRCGESVAMSTWDWKKLKPDHKRMCKNCIRLAMADPTPGYEPGRHLTSLGYHMLDPW